MKEKLVYIGSNIPDKTPAAVRVFANSLALKDYGYNVKIISNDIDYSTEYSSIGGIEVWHLPYPRTKKDWFFSLIDTKPYTSIIDSIREVKVVIAYGPSSIAFLSLRKYCKRKGIKLICETTEWMNWSSLGHLHGISRLIKLLDMKLCLHFAYARADGIIVTSKYFRNQFKRNLHTLILPTLQFQKIELENSINVNPIRKFIYAGGIGYGKDLLCNIIKAFGLIKDHSFEFNIYGLSLDSYLERFPQDKLLIEQINDKQKRVLFHGRVSHETVLQAIKGSDFAVIIRENSQRNNAGFPTKFGESINCGTPVIVSDFSDVVEYVIRYKIGIVSEIDAIEKGLSTALSINDASMIEMKKRCRECDCFFYKEHVAEIGQFVDELL